MPMNASDLDHVTFLGEFGLVFKAHLKWNKSAEAEVVAIKTMKGIYYTLFKVGYQNCYSIIYI